MKIKKREKQEIKRNMWHTLTVIISLICPVLAVFAPMVCGAKWFELTRNIWPYFVGIMFISVILQYVDYKWQMRNVTLSVTDYIIKYGEKAKGRFDE